MQCTFGSMDTFHDTFSTLKKNQKSKVDNMQSIKTFACYTWLLIFFYLTATSFGKSPLQPLIPLMDVMPDQLNLGVPYVLSLMTGFWLSLFLLFSSTSFNGCLIHIFVLSLSLQFIKFAPA